MIETQHIYKLYNPNAVASRISTNLKVWQNFNFFDPKPQIT